MKIRKTVGRAAIALAIAGGSLVAGVGSAQANSGSVCYQTYIRELGGWQSWQCNGAWAGTTGRGYSIISIQFKTSVGELCMRAHRSSYGWDSRYQCSKSNSVKQIGAIGTTPIEAVGFYDKNPQGGWVKGGAHSRSIGWTNYWDSGVYRTGYSEIMGIGTTGRSLPMEALWLAWT